MERDLTTGMGSIVICVGVFVWMNKHTEKYMERT